MKSEFCKTNFIWVTLISLFLLLSFVQAEEQRVRVLTDNAPIRLKPDIKSEIIENPPSGSEFEVEKKIGEWYEIKFISRVGISIIGYIHEKDVEEIKIEEKVTDVIREKPEKVPEISPPSPVIKEEPSPPKKIELVLSGGYHLGYSIVKSLEYTDRFSRGIVKRADEHGILTQEIEEPITFGGALNYFFSNEFGVQLRLDYNSKAQITGISTYNLDFEYEIENGALSINREWDITGDFSNLYLGGNVIFRAPVMGMIAPVLSGGASYFTGKLKVNTQIGYAGLFMVDIDGEVVNDWVDYLIIPSKIDVSINGFGFNVGGGIDILLAPNIGINLDARYFLMSNMEERWDIITGQYSLELLKLIDLDRYYDLDHDDAEALSKEWVPAFELDPSFFKFSAGLVIKF